MFNQSDTRSSVSKKQAPPQEQKTSNNIEKNLKLQFLLSIPLMTLIVITFYAQGRAYKEGYISHLGLNVSLFPVSLEDAYWYAFIGWIAALEKISDTLWSVYPQYLYNNITLILFFAIFPCILFSLDKYKLRKNSVAQNKEKVISTNPNKFFNKKHKEFIRLAPRWSLFPIILISILPLILIFATIMLAFLILVFVMPFIDLGAAQARSDCVEAASRYSTAYYIDKFADNADGEQISSAKLLQCNENFCILIRDGLPLVIQQSNIQSVEGIAGTNTPSHDVPEEQQLCFIPSDSK